MNIQVSTIQELYAAVNSPAHAGYKIILTDGTYTLNARLSPLTLGRLELQENMELISQSGVPEHVIIDPSLLLDASFTLAGGGPKRTGAIRLGRGKNKLHGIEFKGTTAPQALSVIDTDLVGVGLPHISVMHCIVSGGRIGINFRNFGLAQSGRIIEAELSFNTIRDNDKSDIGTQQGQGLVFQNVNGARGAVINVKMSNNEIHGNIIGLRIFNNNASAGTHTDETQVNIDSKNDHIDDNKLGISILAGYNRALDSTVNDNKVRFTAKKTTVRNNKGIVQDNFTTPCGIYLAGGMTELSAGIASDNKIKFDFTGTISGNEPKEIIAHACFSSSNTTFIGVNNVVAVKLNAVVNKNLVEMNQSNVPGTSPTNVAKVL